MCWRQGPRFPVVPLSEMTKFWERWPDFTSILLLDNKQNVLHMEMDTQNLTSYLGPWSDDMVSWVHIKALTILGICANAVDLQSNIYLNWILLYYQCHLLFSPLFTEERFIFHICLQFLLVKFNMSTNFKSDCGLSILCNSIVIQQTLLSCFIQKMSLNCTLSSDMKLRPQKRHLIIY